MVHKIISGGQTGVDRAALDVAIELGLQHGGWCPKGRKAELGEIIPFKYSLKETQSSFFSERTILNLCQSDGTLVITNRYPLEVNDGTLLTINELKKKKRPYFIIDLTKAINENTILDWIQKNHIHTLNVAGPRESSSPGIYDKSKAILETLLVKRECAP